MTDTEIINALETFFRFKRGRCMSNVNGWIIGNYDDGFHVAKSTIDEPLIEQCDLRKALTLALTTKPC